MVRANVGRDAPASDASTLGLSLEATTGEGVDQASAIRCSDGEESVRPIIVQVSDDVVLELVAGEAKSARRRSSSLADLSMTGEVNVGFVTSRSELDPRVVAFR
jgi:hypothetical protein